MSKLEQKKLKITALQQKTRSIMRSVGAQHEQMEILIESINEMHDSILELTEIMKTIAETDPLAKMKMTDEQLPAIEREEVSLWNRWFKAKKATPT